MRKNAVKNDTEESASNLKLIFLNESPYLFEISLQWNQFKIIVAIAGDGIYRSAIKIMPMGEPTLM